MQELSRRAPVAQAPVVANNDSPLKSAWDGLVNGMSSMWGNAQNAASSFSSSIETGLHSMADGMANMIGMGHTHGPTSTSTTPATPAYSQPDMPAPAYSMPAAMPMPPAAQANAPQYGSGSGGGAGSWQFSGGASARPDENQMVESLNVVTANQKDILCRRYPDYVISETRNAMQFTQPTNLQVKCWTSPSIAGSYGLQPHSSVWLFTTTGCYVNEGNIANQTDFQKRLSYCVPPQHWVGTLQPQYGRSDCYQYPSLNSPSMNIGDSRTVDVSCSQQGDDVQGNK